MPVFGMTPAEARDLLEEVVKKEGGVSRFARKIGVTRSLISFYLSGKNEIGGETAAYLGLSRKTVYVDKENAVDPKQEQYEKKRREYKQNLAKLGYPTGTEGVRRPGMHVSTSPDLLKEARIQRIERLSKGEAERKRQDRKA